LAFALAKVLAKGPHLFGFHFAKGCCQRPILMSRGTVATNHRMNGANRRRAFAAVRKGSRSWFACRGWSVLVLAPAAASPPLPSRKSRFPPIGRKSSWARRTIPAVSQELRILNPNFLFPEMHLIDLARQTFHLSEQKFGPINRGHVTCGMVSLQEGRLFKKLRKMRHTGRECGGTAS
jgi:hypothetical protein